MEIHTPRLRLRRARIDDLDAIHVMMSDQRAMRFGRPCRMRKSESPGTGCKT